MEQSSKSIGSAASSEKSVIAEEVHRLAGRPLNGIRVLDLTHAAAGPYATMLMADLGADVLKIERPGTGDPMRHVGEPVLGPDGSDFYAALNRNKKSVTVDMKQPLGRDLVLDLAAVSDVMIQNFRPGVVEHLGLDFESVRTRRPGIVYCGLSAFGEGGPWSERPGNDIIVQSVSGLMGITGEVDGGPVRIGAPVADYSAGLYAYGAIMTALFDRARHPAGQHIEISMLDTAVALMSNYIPTVTTLGKTIPRLGRGHAQIVPYEAMRCSDDSFVMVGAFTNAFWQNLCRAIGREDWTTDPRYETNAVRLENREILLPKIREIFLARTRDEWLAKLDEFDVPSSPILELHEAVTTEQAVARGIVVEIPRGDGTTVGVIKNAMHCSEWDQPTYAIPPNLGADTDDVLARVLDLSDGELKVLAEAGVTRGPSTEVRHD